MEIFINFLGFFFEFFFEFYTYLKIRKTGVKKSYQSNLIIRLRMRHVAPSGEGQQKLTGSKNGSVRGPRVRSNKTRGSSFSGTTPFGKPL